MMHGLPDGAEVMDGGTRGLDLVAVFEGRQRVIVVDAAELGREPGEFRRFTTAEVHLRGAGRQLSVHSSGLGDALLLAEALDVLPQELIIFGVQPAKLDWGAGLSPEVEEALPKIVRGILAELDRPAPLPGDAGSSGHSSQDDRGGRKP
jgi:hydrogenase maturation protease